MVRWEPGARDRLRAAAMDLYVSRGFEGTTAADIAEAAGLTERTFFRHFTDKREVIFAGQEVLEQSLLAGVTAAPADAAPFEVVAAALSEAAEFFVDDHRAFSRVRQDVISENPALQERELLKMATLAASVAAALRARGIPEPAARLAAESGLTVFGVAFTLWIADGEQRTFAAVQTEVLAEFVAVTAPGSTARTPADDVNA